MSAVNRLPLAEKDLLEIWLRIALDSPGNADRFLDHLNDKLSLIATSPRMGRLYPELGGNIRGFPVGDYLIFCSETPEGIEVVRVLHGARDIEAVFQAGF